MNDLQFKEDGSPTFKEYDIVNLGRTGFVEVSFYRIFGDCVKSWHFFTHFPEMLIEYISVFIPVRIQKIQKEEAESPTLHLEWKLQPDWVIITTLEKRLEGLGSYKNVFKYKKKGGGGGAGPSPKSLYVILNAKKYDSSCSNLHSLSLSWHWRICISKVFNYMASSASGQDGARLHVMTVIVLYFFQFQGWKMESIPRSCHVSSKTSSMVVAVTTDPTWQSWDSWKHQCSCHHCDSMLILRDVHQLSKIYLSNE